MPRYVYLLPLLALAACGGSNDEDVTSKYGLKVEATGSINAMPATMGPGLTQTCTQVIVSYKVRSQNNPLPKTSEVKLVSLSKDSKTLWSQVPVSSESGQSTDGSLYGVARGCLAPGMKDSDVVDVSIDIKTPELQGTAVTQTKLSTTF